MPRIAKTSDWAHYPLRFPRDLKVLLQREAELNGRSLNAEIVQRLRRSFDGYRQI